MPYCTYDEVKAAINFPDTGAPVSDADITEFITYSEAEIEAVYNTKFGVVEQSGTADGDYSTTTLSLTTLDMTTDAYVGYVLWITAGTNSGEYRQISANDATKITVDTAFSGATDVTSEFKILKLGYNNETIDGDGTDTLFTTGFPLIELNELTINSVSVTPSYVYQYKSAGKLLLGTANCEATYFNDSQPQLVNLKYVYGVYPLPTIIKRLCILLTGIRTLNAKVGGSYTDFATISLPGGVSGSKGQPYVNLKAGADALGKEAKNIAEQVYRPFTLFEQA